MLLRIKFYSRNVITSFSHITQLINMLIELIKVKTEYYRGLARSHTAPLGASRGNNNKYSE